MSLSQKLLFCGVNLLPLKANNNDVNNFFFFLTFWSSYLHPRIIIENSHIHISENAFDYLFVMELFLASCISFGRINKIVCMDSFNITNTLPANTHIFAFNDPNKQDPKMSMDTLKDDIFGHK